MGIAQLQDLPEQKKEVSQWSMRKLFPFASVAGAVSKQFTNPYDMLLGFSIVSIGLIELLGHSASWLFYVTAFLLTFISFVERRARALKESDKKL